MVTVLSSTWRSDRTSRTPAHSVPTCNGRRAGSGSVSGWRRDSHSQPIPPNRMKPMKTPCHPIRVMKPMPISGASAGTIMKTIMMKLVIRAISRPE